MDDAPRAHTGEPDPSELIEDQYRCLFEQSPLGIFVADARGVYTDVNGAGCRMLGRAREEIVGCGIRDMVAPHEAGRVSAAIAEVEAEGAVSRDWDFLHRDGTIVKTHVISHRLADGRLQAVVIDVGEKRRQEQMLLESERRYAEIAEQGGVLAWQVDAAGLFTYLGPIGGALLDYDPRDLIGRAHFADIQPEDRREPGHSALLAAFGSREAFTRTADLFVSRDGTRRWLTVTGRPITDEQGHFAGFRGFATDITDTRRAEDESLEALDFSRTVINASPIGIAAFDKDLACIMANEAVTLMPGDPLTAFVAPNPGRRDLWRDLGLLGAAESVLDGGAQEEIELRGIDGDGLETWVSIRLSPLPRLRERQLLVMMTDITDSRRAEGELLRTNQQLAGVMKAITETMGKVVETRDPYTQGHQQGVATLSRLIAEEMGLPPHEVDGIEVAALVHDIGKLSVPSEILTKPGVLGELEYDLVKEHSQAGHDILQGIEFDWPIAEIVLQHHERMDGTGYPSGLAGDQIMVAARVIMAADVLEAMTSHRPYRTAATIDHAVSEFLSQGDAFDPDVVAACERLYAAGRLNKVGVPA